MPPSPVACPSCQTNLKFTTDVPEGKRVRCPKCSHIFAPVAVSSGMPVKTPNLDLPTTPPLEDSLSIPPAKPSNETVSASQGPGASLLATEDRSPDADDDDNDIPSKHDFLHPPQQPGDLGRLNHYRIIKVLGAGGMGLVYLGEDYLLQRPVAVKVMLPEYAKRSSAKQRFLREARAAAAIEHDNIIAIHEVNEDNGVPYLIMPLLKGESLADRLKREKKLPLPEVIRIARETALGLAEAHEHSLIHRDIKPSNIWLEAKKKDDARKPKEGETPASSQTIAFLSSAPRVKILDFGLARTLESDAKLTKSGTVLGTPAYMSPEQARDPNVDGRADLFSLGVMMYQMATGTLPFKGHDMLSFLAAVTLDTPEPPRARNPEIPADLNDLILNLLEKDPATRVQTAEEVAARLATVGQAASLPVTPPSTTSHPERPTGKLGSSPHTRRRRVWPLVLVALVFLGVVPLLAHQIIIRIQNKDGSETKIEVPKGAKVIVEDGGKKPPIPPTTVGKDYSLYFDNTSDTANDWAELPGVTWKRGETMTIEGYFHPAKLDRRPFAIGFDSGIYLCFEGSWKINFVMRRKEPPGYVQAVMPHKAGRVHIALVIYEQELGIFVDGQGTKVFMPNDVVQDLGSLPIVLGAGTNREMSRGFHGAIDEVRISNVARYTKNFQPEARFTADKETIALYHLDEGSGDVVKDSSGNNRHGKIVTRWNAFKAAQWVDAMNPFPNEETAPVPPQPKIDYTAEFRADRKAAEILNPFVRLTLASPTGKAWRLYPGEALPNEPFRVTRIHTRDQLPAGFMTDVFIPAIAPLTQLIEIEDPGSRLGSFAPWLNRLAESNCGASLHNLAASFIPMDDENLRKFPRLEAVRFLAQDITEEKIESLRRLPPGIRKLGFYGFGWQQKLTDQGRLAFSKLEVPHLYFEGNIDAKYFSALAAMPKLRTLTFMGEDLHDAELVELGKSRSLRLFTIRPATKKYPSLTEAGVKALAAAMPKCTIAWPGGIDHATETPVFANPKVGETIDLLALIDLEEHARVGCWRIQDRNLISSMEPYESVELPVVPSQAYRIEALAEREWGIDCLSFGLVVGDRETRVNLEGFDKKLSGLSAIDSKVLSSQTGPYQKPIFASGRPTRIIVEVRPGRIVVTCDGETVVDWKGNAASLTDPARPDHRIRPRILYLGTYESRYRISRLTYTALPPSTDGTPMKKAK